MPVGEVGGEAGQVVLDEGQLAPGPLAHDDPCQQVGQRAEAGRDGALAALVVGDGRLQGVPVAPGLLALLVAARELGAERPDLADEGLARCDRLRQEIPLLRRRDEVGHDLLELGEAVGVAADGLGVGPEGFGLIPPAADLGELGLGPRPAVGLGLKRLEAVGLAAGLVQTVEGLGDLAAGLLDLLGGDGGQVGEPSLEALGLGLELLGAGLGAVEEALVALEVHDCREDLEPLGGARLDQALGPALHQQDRRGERLVRQADVLADPVVEVAPARRVGHVLPAARAVARRDELPHLLRDRRAAAPRAAERAAGPVAAAVEREVELDDQAVAVLVDQLQRVLLAVAVLAEQGVRQRVEDGRLAAAVEPREEPERRPVEPELLLVSVAEEALQRDPERDHGRSSSARISSAKASTASRSGWSASSVSRYSNTVSRTLRNAGARSGAVRDAPESVGLLPVAVVPAGEDPVELGLHFQQVVDARRVRQVVAHQRPLGVGVAVAQRGDLGTGVLDGDVEHRRRIEGEDGGLAPQPLGADVHQDDPLLVVALAQVEPFDAPAVADVRPAPQRLRLVDVPQRDVGPIGRDGGPGQDQARARIEPEQARHRRPLDVDVRREDGRQVGPEPRALPQSAEAARVGGGEGAIPLVETLVFLGPLVEVEARRREGHEHELDGPAVAPGEGQDGRLGRQEQAPARPRALGLVGLWRGQRQRVPQGLAEGLVVVVARQRHDRAAAAEERQEDLAQVPDRLAQGVGPAQVAEHVARDQQHVDPLALAVIGHPLDRPAQVGRPVDPPETIPQVPVGGVQDPHRSAGLVISPRRRGYPATSCRYYPAPPPSRSEIPAVTIGRGPIRFVSGNTHPRTQPGRVNPT